jgi:hypothetical protein
MSYEFKVTKGLDFRVGNSPKTPLRARILCLLESKRKGKEAGAKGVLTRSKPPFSLTLLQQRLQNGSSDTPNNVRFCSVFSRMQHNLGEKLSCFSLQKHNKSCIKSDKNTRKGTNFSLYIFRFSLYFRTFDFVECTFVRQYKTKKATFVLYCAHLFVPL